MKRPDRESAVEKRFYSRRMLRAAIVCAAALAVIILCLLLERSESVAEFCSRYISRPIVWLMGHISSVFPFSLFEIFVFAAVAAALTLVVLFIIYCAGGFPRRGASYVTVLAAVALCVGAVYTLCTGFNYYRAEAPLPMAENDEYGKEDYAQVAELFFEDLTALLEKAEIDGNGNLVSPYSFDELNDVLAEEFKRLDDEYFGGYYTSYTPEAKLMASSELMSELHLIGITFSPLGEANLNAGVPVCDLVSTTAHELMHAKGVMRESEANLVSYWLLATSDNDFLRLCGYLELTSDMFMLTDTERHEYWAQRLTECRYDDVRGYSSRYWSQYTALRRISGFFNDIYLAINGQGGTESYNEGSQTEITFTPVYDDEGNPVYDESGGQIFESEIVAYSQIHRFMAEYFLG